jgi:hypothetical protein
VDGGSGTVSMATTGSIDQRVSDLRQNEPLAVLLNAASC